MAWSMCEPWPPADRTTRWPSSPQAVITRRKWVLPSGRRWRSSAAIAGLGERTLDPNSFNPTYYTEGVQSPTKPNGIYIGFDLEFSPRFILYRIFHFVVPPGQEGQDPQLQPKLLNQEAVEISWNADTLMTLDKPDQIVISQA